MAPARAPSGLRGVPLELYVVLLSIVSELVAFTGVGLIARWGEVVQSGSPLWAAAACRYGLLLSRAHWARRS